MHKKWLLLVILAALGPLLLACSGSGLPKQPGEYDIQPKSVSYDGQGYSFYWVDRDKSLHLGHQDNIKMVQDSRTYLEMRGDEPTLHLTPEDPVTVRGEDRRGAFDTFWFPFLIGRVTAGGGGPVIINQPYSGSPQTSRDVPTYHYPPAGAFGRDDTLNGSITNNKPSAPDYEKVSPAPYAVGGKTGGTGEGTAATGKSGGISGQSGGAGAGTAATGKSGDISGQSGGAGAGTAASEKGGFRSGTSSFSSKGGGASSPRVGGGSSKSSGSGGQSAPRPSGGRAGGGGRGGGK